MKNCEFVEKCLELSVNECIKFNKLTYDEIFNLKYPNEVKLNPSKMFLWYDFEILAKINKDVEMLVWNGNHPYDANINKHMCKSGSDVIIWMVSRFGHLGITDNLTNPTGSNSIVEIDDLYEFEVKRINKSE